MLRRYELLGVARKSTPSYILSMTAGYDALTEKEKETLRLLLGGHDAKSIARHLGLSVHTIHERLRDSRRKLSVSSSREAARLLHQIEGEAPELLGDKPMWDASAPASQQSHPWSARGTGKLRRVGWIIGGLFVTISLALLALLAASDGADAPSGAAPATSLAQTSTTEAALRWLALVDSENWEGAYAETGQSFRRNNALEGWTAAATGVRAQYGATSQRNLISNEWVPAPPNGYWIVKFRTMTSKKGTITETLSLTEDGGTWKVVGIVID